MKPELSVLIVNYNGLRFLDDCFASLRENLHGIAYEIIVVDNGSVDGGIDHIETHYPDVILSKSNENLGFGKGNNLAAQMAQGDHLLLINNDTIVLDNLKPVLDALRHDPGIGAAGINMLDANRRYLPSCGNFPTVGNMLLMKKLNSISREFVSGDFTRERYEVDWLGGALLFIPAKVYREVGGFDPDYFMYVEDVDLCRKIADAGYRRIFFPEYTYIHFVGFNKKRNRLLTKGYELYIAKHTSGFEKLSLHLALSLNKTIKTIKSIFGT